MQYIDNEKIIEKLVVRDERTEKMAEKIIEIDERLERVEEKISGIEESMSAVINSQDQMMVILKRLDVDRYATIEWLRGVQHRVEVQEARVG